MTYNEFKGTKLNGALFKTISISLGISYIIKY